MKRYLLDTGIMGYFINRRRGVNERARDARMQGAHIGTCFAVLRPPKKSLQMTGMHLTDMSGACNAH